MEFTRAGTLNLTEGKTSSNLPYRFASPTRLEITLGPLGTVAWDVKLEQDTMTLKGAAGKTIQMKKVKDQAQKPGIAKEQAQPKQQAQAQPLHPEAKLQQAPYKQAQPQPQMKEPQKPQQQPPQGQQQHKS
jgi:hypothetical protein